MLLVVTALCACQTVPPDTLALRNVTVIDATDGLRPAQTVLIDGDKIVAVTPAPGPPTAREIDASGKFLMPGLWDLHVHLTYDDRFTDEMPGLFLRYGITSVRDTGGLLHKMQPVVDAWRADDAVAPRVYYSGPLLDGSPVVYDGGAVPEIGIENATVEQALENVEQLHRAGVDFIKIYELTRPDVFDALSTRARELGLPVASHVPLSMTASTAAEYADSMEHLRNIELDCANNAATLLAERQKRLQNPLGMPGIELRAALHATQRLPAVAQFDQQRCAAVLAALRPVIQVPTTRLNTLSLHPAWERPDWPQALADLPAAVQADWRSLPDWFDADNTAYATFTLQLIRQLRDAGVPIGAGTDTPIGRAIPGYSLHNELALLVAAGLTPLEAIEAATVTPARFFGLQESMGAIAAGMRADLVLLNSNPLLDVRNTRDIAEVVFRGRLLSEQ